MSRTYMQHPELFPYMREHDPYYQDHVRDSYVDRMIPKCEICHKFEHTTESHHAQLIKDLQKEK